MTNLVLVVGATGGVGQLTVAGLLDKGINVRALTRHPDQAQKLFDHRVEVVVGDIRFPSTLAAIMPGITHIICCAGTTAFPSTRWEFDQNLTILDWLSFALNPRASCDRAQNSPQQVDAEGIQHLVSVTPSDLQRFVLISSCGIERKQRLPYSLLNTFGVLDAKAQGEAALLASGRPYTIIRPGRLIDGPYTAYDLNTLLKAKTKLKLGLLLGTGDTLTGQTSRIDLAAACVESLFSPMTVGKVFELVNQGPRPSVLHWETLFAKLGQNH